MELSELNRIKKIIAEAETRKARAEGVVEKIMQQWKAEFGVNSLAEAEAKLVELQNAQDVQKARLKELLDQLEQAADWDELEAV